MKFSIITVVYNNVCSIGDCIRSVLSQDYGDIEYIVIDGASTDGTLDIINRHRKRIAKLISEEDKGYTYAMNKGLTSATGDVVGFLHSDDFYTHKGVIGKVAALFKDKATDSVYGDLAYVRRDNPERVMRCWRSGEYGLKKIKHGWMPPHPAFFIKRKIYEKYGFFDTSFRISADYELILRFLYKYGISASHLSEILVKMRWGGTSNKSIKNIVQKTREDYKAARMYNLNASTVFMKNVIKLPQFFMPAR